MTATRALLLPSVPIRALPIRSLLGRSLLTVALTAATLLALPMPQLIAQDGDTAAPTPGILLAGTSTETAGEFSGEVTATISATDDNVVSRIEYRLDGGEWTDHTHPEVVLLDETQESFDQWVHVGMGGFTRQPDGTVQTDPGGLGMLYYPLADFGDAAVKVEWRDVNGTGNAGVFTRFPEPVETAARDAADRFPCQVQQGETDPAWVAVYCGMEYQINDGALVDAQATGSVYNFQPVAVEDAMTQPPGTWVNYEVRNVGGGDYTATVVRNGVVLNTYDNTPGKEPARAGDPPSDDRQFERGYIGLQNHGFPNDLIQYRRVTVQDLSEPDQLVVADLGAHTLDVRATDAAGNVSEVLTSEFSIVEAEAEEEATDEVPADACDGSAAEDRAVTIATGQTPVDVAIVLSALCVEQAESVVLSSALSHSDGLAASAMAEVVDGPVLLTRGELSAEPALVAELERLGTQTVHIVGGVEVIDQMTETDLRDRGYTVQRHAGATRFETATAIATQIAGPAVHEVIIALGQHAERDAWPDALTAANLVADPTDGDGATPVLLSFSDGLHPETQGWIDTFVAQNAAAYVVGGPAVLSEQVMEDLRALNLEPVRVAGPDRFATAVETLARGERPLHTLLIADGGEFVGAIAAGPAALHRGGGVLLADHRTLTQDGALSDLLRERAEEIRRVIVVDLDSRVSSVVAEQVTAILEG